MISLSLVHLTNTLLASSEALDPMEEVLPKKLVVLFHNEPGSLFHRMFGPDFWLTNNMVMTVIVAIFMLILFPYLANKAKKNPVPTGFHNFFEVILNFLRTDVFGPALGKHTDRYLPYLWTIFFFILFSNLLGLIPGAAIIEIFNHYTGAHIPPFWAAATGNVMVTAGLAAFSFLMIHISGIAEQVRVAMNPALAAHHQDDEQAKHGIGLGGMYEEDANEPHGHATATKGLPFPLALGKGFLMYWWNFAPHDPWWLWFPMLPLEIIGALVKPFALCMRLFANIMAGHVVLASMVGLIFVAESYMTRGGVGFAVVIGSAVLSILELFVAFLQAYIFTFLTTLFLAASVAPEH